MSVLQTAISYLQAGLCVLPAIAAERRPAVSSWKQYQERLPREKEVRIWAERHSDLCIVAGKVSGNLEMIDFDLGAELYDRWAELVESENPGLLQRLVIERSQSGGKHVIYRSQGTVPGNQKLAQRILVTPDDNPVVVHGKKYVPRKAGDHWQLTLTLIETRGEGGLFLCDPSAGYQLLQGRFEQLPVLTESDRTLLIDAAASLNELLPPVEPTPSTGPGGQRPGDEYNRRGDVRAVLLKHGWTLARGGENEHWRRPGKDQGWSATLKDGAFYVFSSNAAPFEPQRAYAPFAVYAMLEHGGNFSRAAWALREEGFGTPPAPVSKKSDKEEPATEPEQTGCVPLGSRDPATNRLVLSPRRTLPTARAFVEQFHTHPDGRTIQSYAGLLLAWRDNRYVELEDESLRHRLQPWLHEAMRYVVNKQTGLPGLVDFESNPGTVNSALESIRSYTHLPASVAMPAWLDGYEAPCDAREVLPGRTVNLHIPTGRILPATPALFTGNALDFDYNPDAPVPQAWLEFLHRLWGDDLEQVDTLQDWFGYSLTADTSQQKMLLLVGPKRSGKGTIGRILTRLVGVANVVGPTTNSLAGAFGLQPLIGKSLAIISDARFSGENIQTVIERLLCITGEDMVTIDRKYLASISMKLATRFMLLTNELPRMTDASGALAGRFIVLRLIESFYGKEDTKLTAKLLTELPGILLWALEGWKRLHARGHFIQPQSAADAVRDMEDLSSPVGAFVRDRCVIGSGQRVWVDELYAAWKSWCEQDGRTNPTTKQTFGRDLMAAVPGIGCRRHSGYGRFYDGLGLVNGGPL